MDCKQISELLWENETSPELEEHLAGCDECRRKKELIDKLKISLSAPDTIVEETMKKIKKENRRHTLLNITKVAACLVVVVALAFFAKTYIDDSAKDTEQDNVITETVVDSSIKDDSFSDTDSADDVVIDAVPDEPAADAQTGENESFEYNVDYDDLYVRLFSFKDSLLLTSKSCDFVIDAEENEVLELLAPYSPELIDGYILLDSDFSIEVEKALSDANIEILVSTSSESVLKTFIFFADNI